MRLAGLGKMLLGLVGGLGGLDFGSVTCARNSSKAETAPECLMHFGTLALRNHPVWNPSPGPKPTPRNLLRISPKPEPALKGAQKRRKQSSFGKVCKWGCAQPPAWVALQNLLRPMHQEEKAARLRFRGIESEENKVTSR